MQAEMIGSSQWMLLLATAIWAGCVAVFCVGGCLLAGATAVLNSTRRKDRIEATKIDAPALNNSVPDAPCGQDGPVSESVESRAENLFALHAARRQGAIRTVMSSTGLLGLMAFVIIAGIENFGMTPILRRALDYNQTKDGIKLSFDSAEGGLIRGDLILRNLSIQRQHPTLPDFDLKCSKARVRCTLSSVFSPHPKVEELTLTELVGSLEIPRQGRIEVGHLKLIDSHINISDRGLDGKPVSFDLTLKSLDCLGFRTDLAPFDVVFRSQSQGTIEGVPFQIESTETPQGVRTEWRAPKLPIKLAQAYLGGPFQWLSAGSIDLQMVQLVRANPSLPVQLDCQMVVSDVQAGVPAGLRPGIAIGAQILVNQLNERSKPLILGFRVDLDRARFDLRTTESLAQLSAQVRAAAISSLLKSTGQNLDFVVDLVGAENSEVLVDNVLDLAARAAERIRLRRNARRESKRPLKTTPEERPLKEMR